MADKKLQNIKIKQYLISFPQSGQKPFLQAYFQYTGNGWQETLKPSNLNSVFTGNNFSTIKNSKKISLLIFHVVNLTVEKNMHMQTFLKTTVQYWNNIR